VRKLSRFAWGVLVYNLGVVSWGAYVRATRSGAGCGAHWPLCNGQVIPSAPSVEMLVEFSHRLTSGLALASVVALLAWTWRAAPRGHAARRGAAWAAFFMLTEAGVGAALVLFQLVADNPSMARAMFMSVHLVNTFALLAGLALTAWWLSGGAPLAVAGRAARLGWLALGAGGLALAGVSGAITALGDTLYPVRSLAEGLSADLSATSHAIIRLRLLHPAITVTVALALVFAGLAARRIASPKGRQWGARVAALAGIEIAAGVVNLLLLAPVWMQLVHLLIADLLWISYVLFAASLLGGWPARAGRVAG
jgi:heme A synthase